MVPLSVWSENQNHYTNCVALLLKIIGWQVAKVCFKQFCSYHSLQGAYAKGFLTDSQLFLLLIQLLDQQWFQILDSLSQDLQLWYSSDITLTYKCHKLHLHMHLQICVSIETCTIQRHHCCWGKPLSSVSAFTDAVTAVRNTTEMAFWFTERDRFSR